MIKLIASDQIFLLSVRMVRKKKKRGRFFIRIDLIKNWQMRFLLQL